jgi:hypothetical protein
LWRPGTDWAWNQSSGSPRFTPYTDQLPGSCRDYFAMDGWVHYATPDGHWLWVSRDAPLMTLGGPHVWARRTDPPADAHRLLAMLFNNCWHTNFAADEHGVMEFQFELVWRERLDAANAAEVAEALVTEPVVLINGPGADDSFLLNRLFQP